MSEKNRLKRYSKIFLSALLTLTMLLNIAVVPIGSVTEALLGNLLESGTGEDDGGVVKPPTSLDDVTIPTVNKNPYDVDVSVDTYPVYSSDIYSSLLNGFLASYGTHNYKLENHSPYYTASIAPWFDYEFWIDHGDDMTVQNDLPYREGRESIMHSNSQMLHSELTLTNGGIMARLINDFRYTNGDGGFKDLFSNYLSDKLGLRRDQLYVQVNATLISGSGSIYVSNDKGDTIASSYGRVTDGKPQSLSVKFPLSELGIWTIIYFDADRYSQSTNHVMTDFNISLIDDTMPSVKHIELKRDVREDNTADLVLEMSFNESVRFASNKVKNELDNIWVEVELLDLSKNKTDTVRLYLQKHEGDKWIFRGDIGLYNYKNFRVNRITKASLADKQRAITCGAIDLADEMYVSAYDKVDYDNRVIPIESFNYITCYKKSTAICDYAGNGINVSSITNWSFGNQSYISNTFDAVEVEIFNTNVVEMREDLGEIQNTKLTDMIVGPLGSMTAYVYLNEELTDEEAQSVFVEFNILNSDGTPLTARGTRITDYKKENIQGDSWEGWILIFEDIQLDSGMTLDVAEGKDVEPKIVITRMFDEIEDKTAYPYVVEPSNILYADLSAPSVTVEAFAENEVVSSDGQREHYLSLAISISDAENYKHVSGLIGTRVEVSLGGKINGEARVKYLISDSAIPPNNKAEYADEAILCENKMASLGDYYIANKVTDKYIHLYIETTSAYINGLLVGVNASDLVGNCVDGQAPMAVDYLIDSIPPSVKFTSQEMISTADNTAIDVSLGINAIDNSNITRILYYVGENTADAEWQVFEFSSGKDVSELIKLHYGGAGEGIDKVYNDTVWIKAIDEYGNESEPLSKNISVSLEKPMTNVKYDGNLNNVSTHHKITVIGPEISTLGVDGYTRVTLTPDNSEYSYVTVVKSGEIADILGFEGLAWYRVRRGVDKYLEVSGPELIENGYRLSEDSLLYELFKYYGELRISFENGYGDMIPRASEYFYEAANVGSYSEDSTYYMVRYASPYDTEKTVYSVDFESIVDKDGAQIVANADKGSAPYKFNATHKGVNPMRKTQIHYSLTNIIRADFALLDFNFEGSYAELIWTGESGNEQIVVVKQSGLFASGAQFFTIGNLTDSGDVYETGAYYLRVTVKSNSGATDVYESSRLVLDASVADNAGLWSYSYQTKADITSLDEERGYSWVSHEAEDKPYTNVGISVMIGGEKMRSNVFAVYSYGVSGFSMTLGLPNSEKTYEGIKVGGIEGFKLWNMLSEPTSEDIENQSFVKSYKDCLIRNIGTDDIYNAQNIPKGADGFKDLYLVKGVNTICYQVKMENGYLSPIRQFTIIVTDYYPELNIAIDDYRPSHEVSQQEGMVNAHSIRFFVETAYSMNGSGNVRVDLWATYGINVGQYDGGVLTERMYSPIVHDKLEVVKSGLRVEDFADITQNSYTADFPRDPQLCTAIFVATDEYGGVTLVAPQIGDHKRYEVSGGEAWEYIYNIDYYSTYFDDPYVVGDSFLDWRIAYNQPVYFGKELLSFENYLYENTEDGDSLYKTLMVSNTELKYNLFNIVSNDIVFGAKTQNYAQYSSNAIVDYQNGINTELIRWDDARITFTGGDLGSRSVTLLLKGEENDIGYDGAKITNRGLSLFIANPKANASNPAGTTVTRNYSIECYNIYGDKYSTEGYVELCYRNYGVERITMEENGATLNLSFETLEYGSIVKTGIFENGEYELLVTDLYGNKQRLTYEITTSNDPTTEIKLSTVNDTSLPITVELKRSDGIPIFVDINDYAIMGVEKNNTSSVLVTVKKNTRFSYRYIDSYGNEQMYYITVDNILEPSPYLAWSYNVDEYNVDENGTKYRYGSVTVYLTDNNFALIDKYTGKIPSFTFEPGGDSTYIFKKEDIVALLGNERVALAADVAVSLDIKLYEPYVPFDSGGIDDETPNVQVLAFSNLNGMYSDEKLALQLENARNSKALNDYLDYTTLEYMGNRADMTRALDILGWSTSYRFIIETVDMSRVRIFIKQGLYSEAPDYETGVSDAIDGVNLNSRLLTVTQKAEFSLFVVDESNNSSSIAFKVDNVGAAPSPSVVKIPIDNDTVKAYILMPKEAESYEFTGYDAVKVESDTNSAYYGKPYVEYSSNDDYTVSYKMIYNGEEIISSVDISISEITLSEMALKGSGVEWSNNNTFEATNKDVTAVISFTEDVKEIFIQGIYDPTVVSFVITGNTVTVTYSANHPEIIIEGVAENGTSASAKLSAVTVIDKNAPELEIVSRVLAKNGRSVQITVSANERVITKIGGYATEERDGRYYYTVTYTENGEYTLEFVDMTGLSSGILVEVDEIVSEELSAEYSLSSNGADCVNDPSELQIEVGDSVFVKPNRSVIAELSGGISYELLAGAWNEITVPEAYGGVQPYIVMTDEYENVLTHQFSKIKVPDTVGPDIAINKKVLSVRVGTDRAAITKELMNNFSAFDAESDNITLSVSFTESIDEIGLSIVEYKATDEAGNTTVKEGKLRIVSVYEPFVIYGEQKLSRDDGIVASANDDIILSVDCSGLYYKAIIKSGDNTVAQMKDGSQTICDYILEPELNLGRLEAGVYTLYIINQNRDYFKIIIVVV